MRLLLLQLLLLLLLLGVEGLLLEDVLVVRAEGLLARRATVVGHRRR